MSCRRLLPVLLIAGAACAPVPEPADLVLRNATVHTADDAMPTAEAVAVRAGRIVYVGSNSEAERYAGPETEVVDLAGRFVFPGLVDAHAHVMGIGNREMTLNLEGATGIDDLVARVKERVDAAPAGEWVVGRGWIETFWEPRRFPTRADLDSVSPNNPVFLTRADGHAGVANSAALRLAGITARTRPPFGGDILRDASGLPTGMLIDRAQGLVGSKIPESTAADADRMLTLAGERSLMLGWTQLHDAGGDWDDVDLLRKRYADGTFKLRVYKALSGPGAPGRRLIEEGPIVGEFDGRLTVRTVKLYLDGALGSRGAALLEPYSDAPGTTGLLTTDPEQIRPFLVDALRRGIQIETHAIGDRANRMLLDLYAEAFAAVPDSARTVAEPRWRDEHTQIVDPADLPRFIELGVIPSMQPSHAIGDLHFAPDRLGMDRLARAYAWQTLIRAGARIAGGSDAPVERGEPMIELYAAVARKDQKGFTGEGWHPEEAMTRDQALKAFTLWSAFAAFEETERGSITVGKWADFTVLDADIMTIPEAEILTTSNVMTVVNGEIVYRR